MIHIDLYRSVQAPNAEGAETVAEWQFETWQEAENWYRATGFTCEQSEGGEDTMLQCLMEGVAGDNTYVGHEIPLMDVKDKYTFYGLSIEGNEGSTTQTSESLDFETRCVVARELLDFMMDQIIHDRPKPDEQTANVVASLNMSRAMIESARVHAHARVDPDTTP